MPFVWCSWVIEFSGSPFHQSQWAFIVKLRSFECSGCKIFFHLWHDGGPNYVTELRNWEAEQASEWSEVVKRGRPPQHQPILTGSNAIPVHDHHRLPLASSPMEFSNFKTGINSGRK